MAITAEFTADFSQFESQSQKAGAAIREFAGKVTEFATEYIGAFAAEEEATKRLESALIASGAAASSVLPAYQAMAAQFQATTRFSDDAVIAAQTLLTQMARDRGGGEETRDGHRHRRRQARHLEGGPGRRLGQGQERRRDPRDLQSEVWRRGGGRYGHL
jgi:hypothetical protein